MAEILKSTPSWFLVFLVMILGIYFLISMKQLFKSLADSITELKDMIKELFDDRNTHSERLKELETSIKERQKLCDERHKH